MRPAKAGGLGEHGARGIEFGEGPVGGAQEAVRHEVCALVGSRDRPTGLMPAGWVNTEPGGSNLVKVPSGARRKP
jgi:hypothetical protein